MTFLNLPKDFSQMINDDKLEKSEKSNDTFELIGIIEPGGYKGFTQTLIMPMILPIPIPHPHMTLHLIIPTRMLIPIIPFILIIILH